MGRIALFGYVRINKPECKIREYEYYRAVYCGLCRSMGTCTGQCSRMLLSYDMTFMVLVRLALLGKSPTLGPGRCVAHPFRRRIMAKPAVGSAEAEVFSLCACATSVLCYHKLRDDVADEKGIRRLKAVLARPFVSAFRRRAIKRYADMDDAVREPLEQLARLEESDCASIDAPAELFGRLLAALLSYGLEGSQKAIATTVGFHLGKWIYLVDAADDFEEDVARGRYNPLARAYGQTLDAAAREGLLQATTAELAEAEKGFDLMEFPDRNMEAVIKNILYLGMLQTAKRILLPATGKECKHDRPL